jgi:hypothetical protein
MIAVIVYQCNVLLLRRLRCEFGPYANKLSVRICHDSAGNKIMIRSRLSFIVYDAKLRSRGSVRHTYLATTTLYLPFFVSDTLLISILPLPLQEMTSPSLTARLALLVLFQFTLPDPREAGIQFVRRQ